ncbi:MAG: flagellar biosynthetic protein FliO [Candidatus Handelsmanbacteria bacterium]|nr:flagellar biosynthetic protein FliO [Candidatus Handelsmanbacteria bacterium]
MDRHFRNAAWALVLSCLIFSGAAGATATPDTAAVPDTLAVAGEGVSYLTLMAKLGLGLALVILLAWGTVFLLRKSAFGQQFGAAGTNIRVMERFYLGPKKAIYLVEIGGRPLALGVTDAAITPLSQWQPGELEFAARPAPPSTFAAQLRSLLNAGRAGSQEA